MDWHGVCHSEGTSGNCGPECEAFLDGDCSIEDEIKEQCMDDMKCNSSTCDNYDESDSDGLNCKSYHEPSFDCNRYKIQLSKLKKQQENNTMNETRSKFDFDKAAQVKGNAVNAFETTKNVIIQMQKGKAVVAGVRTALMNAPGAPDSLKVLLNTPYGDAIVGMILHTMAPILTANPTIISAVKAANVAGAVELSNQFTFIQDTVEQAITAIPGFSKEAIADAMGGMGMGKEAPVDERTDEQKAEDAGV